MGIKDKIMQTLGKLMLLIIALFIITVGAVIGISFITIPSILIGGYLCLTWIICTMTNRSEKQADPA